MKKRYLVTLQGVKDRERYLVKKDMWDWITQGGEPPAKVVAGFKKATENAPDEELPDGDDNDRALCCSYLWEMDDSVHAPDGQREFMKYMKDNNIEIVDEGEWVLY
jgi:hypothetical protein